MKSFIPISCIFIGLFIVQGCYFIPKGCTKIDLEIVDYFPYQPEEAVEFINEEEPTKLKVISVRAIETEIQQYDGCGCHVSYAVDFSFKESTISVLFDFYLSLEDPQNIEIHFDRSQHKLSYFDQYTELDLAAHSFSEVYEFRSTYEDSLSTSVRFAKNIGIISIKIEDREWLISKPIQKEFNRSDLDIEIMIC